MSPADPDTRDRNSEISYQLRAWVKTKGHGKATESSGGFVLPSGARFAPDAAWISHERLRKSRPGKGVCPEFVIELLSPSDRRKRIHAKMIEWIENGALLGWMIDPRERSVTVYRPGCEPEVLAGVSRIHGEGPAEGFVLDLDAVWEQEF